MRENIRKVLAIFKSPGLAAAWKWTKTVHSRVLAICLLTVLRTGASLCLALVTKGLIDGAVSSNTDKLWHYGIMLVSLIVGIRLLSLANASIQVKTTANLQKNMQGMLIQQLLYKDYPSVRGYHSGERSEERR